MAKIFVSYSRKDSVVARKLIEAFKTIEQDVWVDWEDIPPAVDWLEQIFRGIEGSEAFIFLISPDSIASEVCNVEIGRAALNNKRIIPIVLRDVDPKTTNEIIRKLNWTFIREGDNFDEGLAKVKVAIELDLPWVEEHNRLQARALDWHRKKEPSLLLRGRDLRNAQQMVNAATSKDPTPTLLQKTYIQHSQRDERGRIVLWTATGIAVVIMAALSLFAFIQRGNAIRNAEVARANESLAIENQNIADRNAAEAQKQAEAAKIAQALAEENEKIAKAQRSAAKAQIFQSTRELNTSTLLAIDSWQRAQSPEAEEILRNNISLLPIPVAQMTQPGRINSLEFSPNGDAFVTGSANGAVCAWQVEDGKQLFCAPSHGSVNDGVFDPTGEIVVAGDDTGEVQIIRARNGAVQNRFNYGVPIWDLDIRLDGKSLAVARNDGRITIIDLIARERSYDLQADGRILNASFSPSGQWIAAGSSSGGVTLWGLSGQGGVRAAPTHKGEVLTIEFSPNSRFLVSGGKDRVAFVAETLTGRELLRIPNEDAVEDISFSPDGSWFVTASDDRRIRVWDTASGRERVRMLQDSVVKEVKVSANGQWIATTGFDKTVRVWNASTGTEIFQIPLKGNGSVLAFSEDGKYLVSGDESGTINIWDISVLPAPTNSIQFDGFTGGVQYSPSGDWIAASDENRIWLLDKGQLSDLTEATQGAPILVLKSNIKNMVFSPDSKWLGIHTASNEVTIYNIENRAEKTIAASSPVQALAFSPDSTELITGNSDGNMQILDVTNGNVTKTIKYGSGVMSLAMGKELMAIGIADGIMIWDAKSQQVVSDIPSTGDHQHMAFNADGTLLATTNSSGQINVWKYDGSKFTPLQPISKEQALSIAFNPKGGLLALGTSNKVYLIDPASGEEIARIPDEGKVTDVAFSPDGNTLATTSLKVVKFWDVVNIPKIDKNNLIETACSRLIENFSADRWINLFGDEPYRKLCENLPVL